MSTFPPRSWLSKRISTVSAAFASTPMAPCPDGPNRLNLNAYSGKQSPRKVVELDVNRISGDGGPRVLPDVTDSATIFGRRSAAPRAGAPKRRIVEIRMIANSVSRKLKIVSLNWKDFGTKEAAYGVAFLELVVIRYLIYYSMVLASSRQLLLPANNGQISLSKCERALAWSRSKVSFSASH